MLNRRGFRLGTRTGEQVPDGNEGFVSECIPGPVGLGQCFGHRVSVLRTVADGGGAGDEESLGFHQQRAGWHDDS